MRVFEFFSLEQRLPIPISVVAEQVLEQRHVDYLYYYAVPIANKAVAALLYMVEYTSGGPYASNGGGGPLKIAHILYDEELPTRRMRLAVAKELLHICDSDLASSRLPETVDRLIDELLVPDELAGEVEHLIETKSDKAGLLRAAACLFPFECRETLKPKYDSGLVSDDYLAELTELPVSIVRMVMSDLWEPLYQALQEMEASLSKSATHGNASKTA